MMLRRFSKRAIELTIALELLALVLVNLAIAQAPAYTLDWWSTDGGGGVSTGGAYSLMGAMGQPDAGVMAGGSYSLNGGFWQTTDSRSASFSVYLPLILR